jgi:hypothetical protein
MTAEAWSSIRWAASKLAPSATANLAAACRSSCGVRPVGPDRGCYAVEGAVPEAVVAQHLAFRGSEDQIVAAAPVRGSMTIWVVGAGERGQGRDQSWWIGWVQLTSGPGAAAILLRCKRGAGGVTGDEVPTPGSLA